VEGQGHKAIRTTWIANVIPSYYMKSMKHTHCHVFYLFLNRHNAELSYSMNGEKIEGEPETGLSYPSCFEEFREDISKFFKIAYLEG
jgi:hypothetical protein